MAAKKVLDEMQVSKVRAGLERIATTDKSQSLTKNIKDFKNEIQKARKAGRTWKEIACIFNEAGVQVSESLLATECSKKRKKIQQKQGGSKVKALPGFPWVADLLMSFPEGTNEGYGPIFSDSGADRALVC